MTRRKKAPLNVGDEASVEAQGLDLDTTARKRRAAVTAVMSTVEGRSIVWSILVEAGVFRMSYVSGDPYATAFNEGSRNHGNRILAEIQDVCPELYLQAMNEAKTTKEESTNV